MSGASLRAVALEARSVLRTMQDGLAPSEAGSIVVSGMLAEQLARELGTGAEFGAVVVGDGTSVAGAPVLVRVIAGDPSDEDDALVRAADRAGVPIVLVQLWPQAEWRAPFVRSPFVVECKTGEGFPVREIAGQIAIAAEHAPALASRVPAVAEAVSAGVVRGGVVHSALLALVSGRKAAARPLIALEQVRMLSKLRTLEGSETKPDGLPVVAGAAGATLAVSYAFRELARRSRRWIPAPVANTAVAAAGTWALSTIARRLLDARTPSN